MTNLMKLNSTSLSTTTTTKQSFNRTVQPQKQQLESLISQNEPSKRKTNHKTRYSSIEEDTRTNGDDVDESQTNVNVNFQTSQQVDEHEKRTTKRTQNRHKSKEQGDAAAAESLDFDSLYRTSPNIMFIKQKYKMYLDWLNENVAKQQHESTSSTNQPSVQLTWFNFEKSIQQQQNRQGPAATSYVDTIIQNNTLAHGNNTSHGQNSKILSAILSTLNSNNNNNNNGSEQGVSKSPRHTTKSNLHEVRRKKLNSSGDLHMIAENRKSTTSRGNTRATNYQRESKTDTSRRETSSSISPLRRGVKFDQKPTPVVNSSFSMSHSSTNSTPPLKPILKTALHTSSTSHDQSTINFGAEQQQHRVSIANNKTPLKPIGRKSSVNSIDSNQSSTNNYVSLNLASTSHLAGSSSSDKILAPHLKLPPIIGRCSKDFYTVLNEMSIV